MMKLLTYNVNNKTHRIIFRSSVRNFLVVRAPGTTKKSPRTTKNGDAVVQRTTIHFDAPAVKLNRNQQLGRTIRNCNLYPQDHHLFCLNSSTV